MAAIRKSVLLRSSWKVAGVVERAALEMRCTGDCTGGSNPSLSAQRKGERSSPSQKKPSPASSLAGLEFFWLSRCLWHRLSSVQGSPRMGITATRRNPFSPPEREKAARRNPSPQARLQGWNFFGCPDAFG